VVINCAAIPLLVVRRPYWTQLVLEVFVLCYCEATTMMTLVVIRPMRLEIASPYLRGVFRNIQPFSNGRMTAVKPMCELRINRNLTVCKNRRIDVDTLS